MTTTIKSSLAKHVPPAEFAQLISPVYETRSDGQLLNTSTKLMKKKGSIVQVIATADDLGFDFAFTMDIERNEAFSAFALDICNTTPLQISTKRLEVKGEAMALQQNIITLALAATRHQFDYFDPHDVHD